MKQFQIYKHPSGMLDAVKQGWSWPGFFFTTLWALVARLWKQAIITYACLSTLGVLFGAAIMFMGYSVSNGAVTNEMTLLYSVLILVLTIIILIVSIGTSILYGAKGNQWRANKLLSQGYQLESTLIALNREHAIAEVSKQSVTHTQVNLASNNNPYNLPNG